VFVYEDEDERAPEAYAAFIRKLINWLSTKTARATVRDRHRAAPQRQLRAC
jgi:hypothetical protein